VIYPSFFKDSRSKKMINQLLNKVSDIRLGGSFSALKANPWFEGIDWDALTSRNCKGVYIPQKEQIVTDSEIK
jgi:cGMP-dependent protein kinase